MGPLEVLSGSSRAGPSLMRPSENAAARGGFRGLGGCALAWQRRLVFPREDRGGVGAPALHCSLSLVGLRSVVLPHLPQDGLSGLARLPFWAAAPLRRRLTASLGAPLRRRVGATVFRTFHASGGNPITSISRVFYDLFINKSA